MDKSIEEEKEIKEMLIAMFTFGLIFFCTFYIANQETVAKTGTIKNTPEYIKSGRSSRFEIRIQEDTVSVYKIRYILSELKKEQKEKIRTIKTGDNVELYIDKKKINDNEKEIYGIKVNSSVIYDIEDHEDFEQRVSKSGIGIILLSLIGILISKTNTKKKYTIILSLFFFGMISMLFYING